MHPMHPTIKAYLMVAQSAGQRAERERLALATSQTRHERKAAARKTHARGLVALAPTRRALPEEQRPIAPAWIGHLREFFAR
jgi:hypothetical protein